MGQHQQSSPFQRPGIGFRGTGNYQGGESQEDIAHVHHGRVAQQQVQPFLVDGHVPHPNDIADEQDQQDIRPGKESCFHQGLEHEEPVQAKFLKYSGMHHRYRSGSGCVCGGCPGMEGEEGNQRAEPGDEQGPDEFRVGKFAPAGHEVFQAGEGEASLRADHQQGCQQHHGGKPQVKRGAPGRGAAVAASIQADHHEGGDKSQFMEGEEGDHVVGQERPGGACGNQKGGVVPGSFPPLGRVGAQHGGEGNQDGQQQHYFGQGRGQRELEVHPFKAGPAGRTAVKANQGPDAEGQRQGGAEQGCRACGRLAQTDEGRGNQRNENKPDKHGM